MPDAARLDLTPHLARFGLSAFRPGQEDVIRTVLAGQDCLCVMPTGGGKSLCYQLPAIALDGLTLVVSPLIALMKDQVDQLQRLGLPVTFINSTLPMAEQYNRLDRLAAGEFRLAYVVPERFRSGRFLDAVRQVGLKLLAVDEAHCISEWGHDFRPDYARLGLFRRMLGNPPTIALTATATDQVRRDIVEQLDLHQPRTFMTGFARPNLFYEVQTPRNEKQKPELLIEFLKNAPGAGIIYASTRKRTEEVAELVAQQTRRRTAAYHAGLLPDQRRAAQDGFMAGRHEIVVATNAFGMGIDKADVRFVVHYNLPGSIEAYYQEAGRAGRDGKPSRCLMLYHVSDRFTQEYFIENAYPGRENVAEVYNFLREREEDPIEMTQQEVRESIGLSIGAEGVGNCEQLLEGAGVLERLIASQNMAAVRLDSDLPTLVDLLPKQARVQRRVLRAVERLVGDRRQELVSFNPRDLDVNDELDGETIARSLRELNRLESFTYVPAFRGRAIRMIRRDLPFEELEIDFAALEERKAAEIERLERTIAFATSRSCRQQAILRYFGEADAPKCGHCDNCHKTATVGRANIAATVGRAPVGTDGGEGGATTGGGFVGATTGGGFVRLLEAVRMVLSGVARTQARVACGKNVIAQMLCGSASAKVKKLNFDKLSTYGLLKHLKQTDVVTLIEALIAVGLLEQSEVDRFRPVVELAPAGAEVMRGAAPLDVALPIPDELLWRIRYSYPGAAEGGGRKGEGGGREAEDGRGKGEGGRGRAEGGRRRAEESAELANDEMWYGDAVAEDEPHVPREITCNDSPAGATVAASARVGRDTAAPAADAASAIRSSHYWTWRLLVAGFSPAECAAIRGMTPTAVFDDAVRAAESGWSVRPEWFLSPELSAALSRVVGKDKTVDVRTLLTRLPPGTREAEVAFYLKCRAGGGT